MTRNELAVKLAVKEGISYWRAKEEILFCEEIIMKELKKGGRVSLIGFGTFTTIRMKEVIKKLPGNEHMTVIPEHRYPVFKPGKYLKEAVKDE